MRTGTAHIKTGVDTAKHSESGGILNMKMCPDIYTWVGTLHIATSGESAYYSVSGGTPHMKSCSNVHTGVGTQRKIQRQRIGGLAGLLALSVITVPRRKDIIRHFMHNSSIAWTECIRKITHS